MEEALRLERGLKKRLTQVEELARLETGGTVLSVDQVRKMSRRSILESEAEKLLPLLARLRVIDKAREVREKERERAAAAAAVPLARAQAWPWAAHRATCDAATALAAAAATAAARSCNP